MESKKVFKVFAQGLYVNVWKNTTEVNGLDYNFLKVDIQDTYKDKEGTRKTTDKIAVDRIPLLIASLEAVYKRFTIQQYDEFNKVIDAMR